jgi:hypothetical protein
MASYPPPDPAARHTPNNREHPRIQTSYRGILGGGSILERTVMALTFISAFEYDSSSSVASSAPQPAPMCSAVWPVCERDSLQRQWERGATENGPRTRTHPKLPHVYMRVHGRSMGNRRASYLGHLGGISACVEQAPHHLHVVLRHGQRQRTVLHLPSHLTQFSVKPIQHCTRERIASPKDTTRPGLLGSFLWYRALPVPFFLRPKPDSLPSQAVLLPSQAGSTTASHHCPGHALTFSLAWMSAPRRSSACVAARWPLNAV